MSVDKCAQAARFSKNSAEGTNSLATAKLQCDMIQQDC